jgi:biotin carboxylase
MRYLLLNRAPADLYARGSQSFLPELGEATILATPETAPTFATQGLDVRTASEDSPAAMERAALQLSQRTHFDAIVTVAEPLILPAARLREQLKVPGDRVNDVLPFRDKILMKHRVAGTGIRVPDSLPFDDLDAATDLFQRHGVVVVKPRTGMGAIGMRVIRTKRELDAAFDARKAGEFADGGYEVEEYIDGDLVHVDTVLEDGKLVVGNVGRYFLHHRSGASFLDLEFGGSAMLEAGPLRDDLVDQAATAVQALGQVTGVAHTELFLTPDGDVVFCETGARPGGGGIAALVGWTQGVNLVEAHLRLQLGLPAPRPHHQHRVGASAMFYGDGRIVDSYPNVVAGNPDWVVAAHRNVPVGAAANDARSSVDAVLQYLIVAPTSRDLRERLDWLRINGAPHYRDSSAATEGLSV